MFPKQCTRTKKGKTIDVYKMMLKQTSNNCFNISDILLILQLFYHCNCSAHTEWKRSPAELRQKTIIFSMQLYFVPDCQHRQGINLVALETRDWCESWSCSQMKMKSWQICKRLQELWLCCFSYCENTVVFKRCNQDRKIRLRISLATGLIHFYLSAFSLS